MRRKSCHSMLLHVYQRTIALALPKKTSVSGIEIAVLIFLTACPTLTTWPVFFSCNCLSLNFSPIFSNLFLSFHAKYEGVLCCQESLVSKTGEKCSLNVLRNVNLKQQKQNLHPSKDKLCVLEIRCEKWLSPVKM